MLVVHDPGFYFRVVHTTQHWKFCIHFFGGNLTGPGDRKASHVDVSILFPAAWSPRENLSLCLLSEDNQNY